MLAAASVAALYLILDLRTGDLAAHLYRADLFAREGFTIWNGNWYGGHHTPAYSVLFPPLAHYLTPQVAGAIAAVAAAALFEQLAHAQFGEKAKWGALWFGVAVGVTLFTGRLPFLFGTAVGLGALLALQRRHVAIAAVLAVLCSLASPVAGLFLALAALAYEAVARTRSGALLAGLAVAAPVLLSVAFPEGGFQPFTFRSFAAVPIFCALLFVLLPREQKTLRVGAVLYGLAATAAYLIDTPMGNNAVRLAELFGAAIVLCFLPWRHELRLRRGLIIAVIVALAVWPVYPTVRDVIKNVNDESTQHSYYEPLLDFLEQEGREPGRIEIPFTRAHFEAYEVARQWPIARGWQRQLDIERNKLFYGGVFNDFTYATWLSENGVRYVALPDAPLDSSSRKEKDLIEREPPIPPAGLVLGALEGLRGHAPAPAPDRRRRRGHPADQPALGRVHARRARAGRGPRARRVDALLAAALRVRRARRALDAGDRGEAGAPAGDGQGHSRAADRLRPPLRLAGLLGGH